MWQPYLSLLRQSAGIETQQGLEEAISEVQRRIALLEEALSWRLPAIDMDRRENPWQYGYLMAKEFHNINPFEGRILWCN